MKHANAKNAKNDPAPQAVGIDVSKASLSVALLSAGSDVAVHLVKNNLCDITAFMQDRLAGFSGKIVMESTGRYHLLPALVLSEAGFDVRVINPLLTKKYATSAIRKLKTDKADAKMLARMAVLEENLPGAFVPDRRILRIRKKMALINALEKNIQQLKSVMKNYAETLSDLGAPLSAGELAVRETLKELVREKERLTLEVIKEAKEGRTEKGKENVALLVSVPGVSHYLAALTDALFFPPNVAGNPNTWIAYIGLDVAVKESGEWKGKCLLTKRGNVVLRKRLFSAAWGAIMNNARFRKYYDELKEQGRHHYEALIIIARKILRIMFCVLKRRKAFDLSLAFKEA